MRWWHQIDLGDEITPGSKDSKEDLKQFKFPSDFFLGKTVLDIGAWDGFFSFYAEKMGASRVLAVDPYMWQQAGGQDGFNYAHAKLQSRVESSLIPLQEISEKTVGLWDIVLFLGVFYHLPEPQPILKCVSSVCRKTLVLETLIDVGLQKQKTPQIKYYEKGISVEIKGKKHWDKAVYWGPNTYYVDQLLKELGFKDVQTRLIYGGSRSISYAEI